MTKLELFKELEQYPDDMLVVTRGYEGGYENATDGSVIEIDFNENADEDGDHIISYYGIHSDVSDDSKDIRKAILI